MSTWDTYKRAMAMLVVERRQTVGVIVSGVALWLFVAIEGRRIGMRRRWAPLLGLLTVGVSLGLPLFLYMRERHLDREET